MNPIRKAGQAKGFAHGKDGGELPPIPLAGRCNCTALRKATRRISQLYDAVLATSGLRATQFSLLVHIARAGAPTVGELAGSLVLDRSALAHNLKPLERDGLVQVVVDQNDHRTRLAVLTNSGRAKLAESMPRWERAQECFETLFGGKKAKALRASLEFLASAESAQAFRNIEGSRRSRPKPIV